LRSRAEERARLLANLIALRIALALVAVGVATLFGLAAGYDDVMVAGLLLGGLGVLLVNTQATMMAPLAVSLRLGRITAVEVLRSVVTLVAIAALALAGASLLTGLQAREDLARARPDDPVGHESVAALVAPHGGRGQRPETPVDSRRPEVVAAPGEHALHPADPDARLVSHPNPLGQQPDARDAGGLGRRRLLRGRASRRAQPERPGDHCDDYCSCDLRTKRDQQGETPFQFGS
jgi:hypothetical protein